ncbi:MAG TPA: hypothetical protein PLH39_04640, partial [Promineifilum sp.]|nr:hypothetical protein [Promineifilum sp.]
AGYIVLNATAQYGVGLSEDSVVYMAAAENIAAGNGFLSSDGTPVTLWPPLYPAMMAFFVHFFDVDVLVVARALAVALAMLVVLLTGVYAFQLGLTPIPALGAVAMTTWAYPLLAVRIMAWTEPPFIFFVLLALVALTHFVIHRRHWALVAFVLAAALAGATRFVGVVLIPVGVLVCLWASSYRWPARLASAAALAVIGFLPIALMLARNWRVSGTLMGPRQPPTIPLVENIQATAKVTAGWFLPSSLMDRGFVVLVGVLLLELVGAALILAATNRQARTDRPLQRYLPTVLFIVFYVTFLLVSSATTNLNIIDDRYMIPVFIPLMMIVFGSATIILQALATRLGRTSVNLAATIVLVLLLAWPLRVGLLGMRHWHNNGEGFAAAIWETNETLRYLTDNPALLDNRVIYSNYHHLIYVRFRKPASIIPYHYVTGSTRELRTAESLRGKWPSGEAVVIWFNWGKWKTFLFRPDELSAISHMTETVVTADGSIWEASPLPLNTP